MSKSLSWQGKTASEWLDSLKEIEVEHEKLRAEFHAARGSADVAHDKMTELKAKHLIAKEIAKMLFEFERKDIKVVPSYQGKTAYDWIQEYSYNRGMLRSNMGHLPPCESDATRVIVKEIALYAFRCGKFWAASRIVRNEDIVDRKEDHNLI